MEELKREKLVFKKYVFSTYKDQLITSVERVCSFDTEDVSLEFTVEIRTLDYFEEYYIRGNPYYKDENFNNITADSLTIIGMDDPDLNLSKY
jgi:hypothetical protein